MLLMVAFVSRYHVSLLSAVKLYFVTVVVLNLEKSSIVSIEFHCLFNVGTNETSAMYPLL
jgi:hypothetical protein